MGGEGGKGADISLSIYVCKTKEVLIDFRKSRNTYTPVTIDCVSVEVVDVFKFIQIPNTQ